MEEIDAMRVVLGDLVRAMESSKNRRYPITEIDLTNRELLKEAIPVLSQERASELMQGMLVLADLVPPKEVPPLGEQIDGMKDRLRVLETVSAHLHNALDGVESQ